MSSKYLNYICYVKALNYLDKRLMKKEILQIQEIKNLMNNKRTNYNWDHTILYVYKIFLFYNK